VSPRVANPPRSAGTTAKDILREMEPLGSASYKKVMLKHGIREPFFGVKIGDLKKIQKRIKMDHQLALDLYDTGNSDAMYLAGLIADDAKMTRKDLERWVKQAYCSMHSEFTVAWVAAGSPHGWELGIKWIESKDENVAAAGWSTLRGVIAMKDDAELDLPAIAKLLERVKKTIHDQPNHVRYVMNGFVIAVGSYIKSMTAQAIQAGKQIGTVTVDMGDTECKVPYAPDYIKKVQQRGAIGKKRKSAKC
jgi:3-methyladenine DNA glycosylase AlkD